MLVGAVGVPVAEQGAHQQEEERRILDVVAPVFGRSEEHHVHGFDGHLLAVDRILDTQNHRVVVRVVHRQPAVQKKETRMTTGRVPPTGQRFRGAFQARANIARAPGSVRSRPQPYIHCRFGLTYSLVSNPGSTKPAPQEPVDT